MTPEQQLATWTRKGVHNYQHMYIEDGIIKDRYCGEVKPCKFCGDPAGIDAKCDGCWEMVSRIEGINNLELAYKIGFVLTKKIHDLMEQ